MTRLPPPCASTTLHRDARDTAGAAPRPSTGDAVIDIYDGAVPGFVAAELERLYENIYTTQRRHTIYNEIAGASTYVKRSGGQIRAVFLFRRERHTLRVLNQQIAVSESELGELCEALFAHYPAARTIAFFALECQPRALALPHRRYWCLEDIVLRLPPTLPQYMDALGQKMRYNLRSCERKILRDFPSFSFVNLDTAAAGEPVVRAIIALAAARMASKGRPAYLNDADTQRIVALVAAYGMVGVARIDGRICGGQICYRVGNNYFMHIVAHDPRYDSYRLGALILLYTFTECIARGARECSLMGGGNAHKARFLGTPRDFHRILVYRSRLRRCLDMRQTYAAARHHHRRLALALLALRAARGRPPWPRWPPWLVRAGFALGAVARELAARRRRGAKNTVSR